MGRPQLDRLLRLRIDPAVQDPAAWEHEGMRLITVDDGKLKLAIERRRRNGLPHRRIAPSCGNVFIDLDQPERGTSQRKSPRGQRAAAAVPRLR